MVSSSMMEDGDIIFMDGSFFLLQGPGRDDTPVKNIEDEKK